MARKKLGLPSDDEGASAFPSVSFLSSILTLISPPHSQPSTKRLDLSASLFSVIPVPSL
jgi:hypothetical protein